MQGLGSRGSSYEQSVTLEGGVRGQGSLFKGPQETTLLVAAAFAISATLVARSILRDAPRCLMSFGGKDGENVTSLPYNSPTRSPPTRPSGQRSWYVEPRFTQNLGSLFHVVDGLGAALTPNLSDDDDDWGAIDQPWNPDGTLARHPPRIAHDGRQTKMG